MIFFMEHTFKFNVELSESILAAATLALAMKVIVKL